MEKKFNSIDILTNGFGIGLKNIASLLGAVVLWVLTCWIPYINIGTTIAMTTLPIEMAKGNVFSPLVIFDKKYFAFIGEYFLITGLMISGILTGFAFFIIPGIVISLAWSLAVLLLIDKNLNPMEALTTSNKVTQGYKWIIFLAQLLFWVAICIFAWLFGKVPAVGWLLQFLLLIAVMPVALGMQAFIYKKLCKE